MKKRNICIILTVFMLVVLLAAFSAVASAEKKLVAEGYCVNGQDNAGAPVATNIKWEIYDEDGSGVIYFNIDKSKGDQTILYSTKADGTKLTYWKAADHAASPWGSYTVNGSLTVTKMIIGDGITEISGPVLCGSKIAIVEIPKTLVALKGQAFANASKLVTVSVRGEESNEGVIDLSYVTTIDNNGFEGVKAAKKYKFSSNLSGVIKFETFKRNSQLTELDFPEGINKIDSKAFNESNSIQRIIFRGKNVEFHAASFEGLSKFPRLVGYVGSTVDTYAKANGFTFINIETDEVVYEGTKPLVEIPKDGEEEKPPVVPDDLPKFDPTGATAHGHMTGEWNGRIIIDTYWAYYGDTKTLEFVSNTKEYNESGSLEKCDDKIGWRDYIHSIEHVIVGPYIGKLSHKAFNGLDVLKDVRLSPTVTQMDSGVFWGCSKLTTVWIDGEERIEGLADFSKIKMTDCIEATKIVQLKLNASNQTLEGMKLPGTLETIITPNFNDTFDQFCKENLYDLRDTTNTANIKQYCIRLDPSWTKCGSRSAYSFDKSTGTLTVHGVGATKDIVNYFGGNSKNQPWFAIKQEIKHVVITEHITGIGKYAFTECKNLETVQLTARKDFTIGAGAFQDCPNLKSIYVEGNQPIEGTLDLRTVTGELPAWTFAYDYLIANIIVSDTTKKIGNSTFEENVAINLKGVYGTPGSYAETYAQKNNLAFYDISAGMPSPITCTPPPETEDTIVDTDVPGPDDTTKIPDETVKTPDTTTESDSTDAEPSETRIEIVYESDLENGETDGGNSTILIVAVAAVVVVAAVVAVVLINKKKKSIK